jgi:DNA replication protein DnaC
MSTTTGKCCECGAAVTRQTATGMGAAFLNRLPFQCEPCAERLEAEWEHEDRENERREREALARRRIETWLPRNLRRVDLDALDRAGCADAIDAARRWAHDRGGLLLTGPFGVGKTTIAAGALRLRFESGRSGCWISAPLLLARLGSGLGTRQREQTLDLLTGTMALVLDDLDKTRPTEYGAEQVFLAVDGAVTNDRPLLVTTNLSLGELAGKWPAPFGEAIASRLVGCCQVIELTGHDRRLEAAA